MPATPNHKTATSKLPWDGPAAEKNIVLPAGAAAAVIVGNKLWAWRDPDGDPTKKQAWKLPHHLVVHGAPGAADVKGCQAAIGAMNGSHGSSAVIPEGDKKAVHAHLAAHLKDAGVTAPELTSAPTLGEYRQMVERNRKAEAKLLTKYGPAKRTGPAVPAGPGVGRVMSPADRREFRRSLAVRGVRQRRDAGDFDLATGANTVTLSGWASRTGVWYGMWDLAGPYRERIAPKAFTKTLQENPRVVALINHEGLPLARYPETLSLTPVEDGPTTGLWTVAQLDGDRGDVKDLISAVKTRALIGMSFAFMVVRQSWDDDYTERTISEVSLNDGDVSFVGASANSWTDGSVEIGTKWGYPDPTHSGGPGYTETQMASLLAEYSRLVGVNRDREADLERRRAT